jgi:hypothetical protein
MLNDTSKHRFSIQAATEYDWEETTNLNLVLHQFEYTVTTAVCTKTSNKHLQILKRLSTVRNVYDCLSTCFCHSSMLMFRKFTQVHHDETWKVKARKKRSPIRIFTLLLIISKTYDHLDEHVRCRLCLLFSLGM